MTDNPVDGVEEIPEIEDPLEDDVVEGTYTGNPWDPEPVTFDAFLEDVEKAEKKFRDVLGIRLSDFAKFAFRLPSGKTGEFAPFSFEGRRHMLRLYDTPARRILLKCARQTEKSTFLGNKMIGKSCIIPGHKSLYVSPSATQSKTFSTDRVKDPIETSDILPQFTSRSLSQNVFMKQFINRAQIIIRYAFLSADRVRGTTPWLIALDEFQDLLADNIPVIEQSSSHAPEAHRSFIYGGTPKGLDNPLEYYWSATTREGKPMSTQCEWVVPCEGCNHWNILGEKNIGRKSLICEKCGKKLDPQNERAQWAAANSDGFFEGYRIPQLMVPWRSWDEILIDYTRYQRAQFYNEVLGLSFDSGMRPITQAELRAMCNPKVTMSHRALKTFRGTLGGADVYAGIDWGADGSSYTVLTLATYVGDKYRIFYVHRFDGEDRDPDTQVAKIIRILKFFNAKMIGVDYGAGFMQNNQLIRAFGARVVRFQYVARAKKKVNYEPGIKRFIVNRSEVMSDMFSAMKRGNVFELPRWEEFSTPYGQDILNIFTEYNSKLRLIVYQHRPDRPDDTFHSITFGFLGSMVVRPRPDIITPRKELRGQFVIDVGADHTHQG